MGETFIVQTADGGLGDHLFYSHLPRIAKQSGGYKRVLISNRSQFRHADYRRLIWEANPYVDGFTEEGAPTLMLGGVARGTNILDAVMLFRKLDDGARLHEPELYYEPRSEPLVAEATVYDPNFVSYVGDVRTADVDCYLEQQGIKLDFMLKVRGKAVPATRCGEILEASSFEHYCAILRSSKRFVCLTSGGATLAAGLGKPVTALWGSGQNTMFHHSRLHSYVNVHPNLGDRYFPHAHQAGRGVYLRAKAAVRRHLPSPAAR